MTVVLGPGWPGVLLHEAIGHGLEGDFNRKGSSRVFRPHRRARRGQGRHRGRRRHAGRPPRLAQHRRRRQSDPVHHADRGRHPERLYPGHHERAADEDAGHRQRPARVVRAPADAAHDQYLHAGRRQATRRKSSPRSRTACMRSISAAARSTSPAASSCFRPARPT